MAFLFRTPVSLLINGLAIASLLACSPQKADKDTPEASMPETQSAGLDQSAQTPNADTTGITRAERIIYMLPSPLQIATAFKRAGVQYFDGFLSPATNVDKYNTNASRALNLGIYGADLAYATMLDQTQASIKYMKVSKDLSDALNIKGLFDNGGLFNRFQAGLKNKDSLSEVLADMYSETDQYLKENERFNTAALVAAGGWIEGFYLATQIARKYNNERIIARIGDEKLSLENLVIVLGETPNDPEITKILKDLKELQGIYGTPREDEEDVPLNKEQLTQLTKKIETIRMSIVNNK